MLQLFALLTLNVLLKHGVRLRALLHECVEHDELMGDGLQAFLDVELDHGLENGLVVAREVLGEAFIGELDIGAFAQVQ